MSLINQAILDLQSIMENGNEFGTAVSFKKRGSELVTTVNCLTNKIMVDVEGNGMTSISERTTIAVHENTLTEANYTVRNANNQVSMIGDLVTMTVMDEEKNYTIKYQIPDQKLGSLVFVLESYNNAS